MTVLLSVVEILLSILLIACILLQSGKDTGLTTSSTALTGAVVERNLQRFTLFVIAAWLVVGYLLIQQT